MHPAVESIKLTLQAGLEEATRWAGGLNRRTLAWGGLALGAVTLLSVNLFAGSALRAYKADLTNDGLFTISDGTRKALRAIDEPIDVRVYFSKKLGDAAPNFAKTFERLRSMLDQYRDISGGRLRVSYIDPEPFSDAEDRAVASGLRGIRLNPEGEQGYFGLVASNTTDNDANIGFFAAERERYLEYDVTKLIYSLANPKKKVVGLVSSLPIDGGMMPMMGMGRPQQIPPQTIMEQIREVFEIKTIDTKASEIPPEVDVLMLVEPDPSPELAYAIDQWVLKGGKVLAFTDPNSEMAKLLGPMMAHLGQRSGDFDKLLKAWGVNADVSKVAGDISFARRVQFGGGRGGGQGVVTDYVAWMVLDKRALDQRDPLAGGIEKLNLATAGVLTKVDGATTTLTPVVQTTAEAMQIPTEKFGNVPDAVSLLRAYKPEKQKLTLAARVSGEAKTAFPDGAPKPKEAKLDPVEAKDGKKDEKPAEDKKDGKAAEPAKADPAKPAVPHVASGKVNVIVVADTDLLTDQFWVDVREFLGQQIAVPNAQNSAFVLSALENLSGSEALMSLRGRGISDRPFEHVNMIRRDAERRFRDKEQSLTAKLKELTEQLTRFEKASESGEVVLSDKDKQAIEKFRGEMVSTRRELRDVKLELRKDIDRLEGWLKFFNIAAVPLLIGIGGIGWAMRRRRGGQA